MSADEDPSCTSWPIVEQRNASLSASEVSKVEQVVHDLLGPDQKIVGVEKKVIVREEEVIMVNGTPIALEGVEGEAIKECLLRGAIPNQDLLNHLLYKVKIQKFCIAKTRNSRQK